MVRISRTVWVTCAIALFALAGCGARGPAYEHPAAVTVAELLELRSDDVRDVEAYTPYFLDPAVATALAEPSDVATGTPRVPGWEPPYVSEEASTTASVVVVWKPSEAFPGWPAANIFRMSLVDDRWVITDAEETSSAPAPIGAR
jgi:predicted small lipoprotein YifL